MNKLILITFLTLLLQGCLAVVVAGGAGAAVMAEDRRTLGFIVEDENIETKALTRLSEHPELDKSSHVNFISYNGIVLVIGQTPTSTSKTQIGELVRTIPHVKTLHNEIRIAGKSSLATRSSDSYITTKIKTKMTFEKNFDSNQIKVNTENGEVFLMGVVTRQEAEKAIAITKTVSGVQKVINVFEYL